MEGQVEKQRIFVRLDLIIIPDNRFSYAIFSLALVSAVARSGRMVVDE